MPRTSCGSCEAFRIQIAYDHQANRAHISAEIEAPRVGHLHELVAESVGL